MGGYTRGVFEIGAMVLLCSLTKLPWPWGNAVIGMCVGGTVAYASALIRTRREKKRLREDLESAVSRMETLVNKPM